MFTNKYTTSHKFDDIHKVVLIRISNNIKPLTDKGKYGDISMTN